MTENPRKARGLNLFKLIVALGFIAALFYVAFQSRREPVVIEVAPTLLPTVSRLVAQPTSKLVLPVIPPDSIDLRVDEGRKRLLSLDGRAVYELDEAGTGWQPLLAPELAAQFGGLALAKDPAGDWILAPEDGIARYRWDKNSLSFVEVEDILATLPPFPETETELRFDVAQGGLVDQGGVILFRLSYDLREWVPTVTEEILTQSGATEPSRLDSGEWVVINPDGKVMYRLVPASATWETVKEPGPVMPELPASDVKLIFDEESNQLRTLDGKAVYILLNSESSIWIPVIPKDVADNLPEVYTVSQEDGSWVINGLDGTRLFILDSKTLVWVAPPVPGAGPTATASPESPQEPLAVACKGALPSRIHIGDKVRVVTSLNLRSTPGILRNLIRSYPAGTTLEVIGGPECLPHKNGVYIWWNVKHPDGSTGWSAEGSITSKFYFLEIVD